MSLNKLVSLGVMSAVALGAFPILADAQVVQREYQVYRDDTRTDARFDTRHDPRFDTRHDPRFDTRYDSRFDARHDRRGVVIERRTDPRVDRRHETRFDRRYETRYDRGYQPRLYGHPTGRIDPGRVDIRRLRAEAHRRWDGWTVNVEYRVRFRDGFPMGNQELLLSGFDRGRPVLDTRGHPIVVAVPLDRVTRTSGSRTYFEGTAALFVPDGVVWTDDVRIHGEVVDRRTGAVLETDTTRLRIR
jgi:hypothetical protein